MPDESCRACGGELVRCSLCSECGKTTQKKCILCNSVTRKQIHDRCTKVVSLTNSRGPQVVKIIHKTQKLSHGRISPSSALAFGIVGLFILGVTLATHSDLFEMVQPALKAIHSNSISLEYMQQPAIVYQKSFKNCLAYGSGESVTVTCPTDYGSVYKAILDMPKELSAKFSDAMFSIRGVSVNENTDGSVVFRYLNNEYKTNFFAN
jgi:hypothetical protein